MARRSPLALTAVAILAAAHGGSCGQSNGPAMEGSGATFSLPPPDDAGGAPSGPPTISTGDASICKLTVGGGPDAGVCGCEDLPTYSDLPNLYFVLDRSGSMNDNNKWTTIVATVAQIIADIGPRANFGAAVFPNPASLDCSTGVEVMSLRQGDTPAGALGPVAHYLVAAAGPTASGGTPTTATLLALFPGLADTPGRTFIILATDGGPNCNAQLACGASTCCPNLEDAAGCPVGGPPNCCDPSLGGGTNCLDGTAAAAAVAQVADAGIPVYVIGVPGSGPYADILNQMATAGGTARSSLPYYYDVTTTDQAAFLATISQVAATITGTCTFSLGNPPADPNDVNVFLNGSVLPQTGPDGWTISGATITVLGNSCASILNGNVLSVRVVAGCPTVIE